MSLCLVDVGCGCVDDECMLAMRHSIRFSGCYVCVEWGLLLVMITDTQTLKHTRTLTHRERDTDTHART